MKEAGNKILINVEDDETRIALINKIIKFVKKSFEFFIISNYKRVLILKNPISSKAVSTETMMASSNTVRFPAKRC